MPPGVTTVMSTAPVLELGGLVAVMEVSLLNVYEVAVGWPKFTAVTPVKPLPEMDTMVPPSFVPVVGEMPVTTGWAGRT